jgi:cell wall assembly regulator SMI1
MTPTEGGFKEFFSTGCASEEALRAIERNFNCALPAEYKQFMTNSGSGEGFVGENYLILWKVDELIQFNGEYEVEEYAPGLLLFGSNGGGEGYAFDTRPGEAMKIRIVPFVGMSLEDAKTVAPTFREFLAQLVKGSPFQLS